MKEIKAIIQPFMVNHVLHALHGIAGLPAVTISEVRAIDTNSGRFEQFVKSKLEIMVPDEKANEVVQTIQRHAHTGKTGDGRVFVIDIEDSISIRTGQGQSLPKTEFLLLEPPDESASPATPAPDPPPAAPHDTPRGGE